MREQRGARDPEGGPTAAGDGDREFDVPAVLAQLDAEDEETRLEGVRAVHRALEDEPERAVPTVPKLRSLLGDESTPFRGRIAFCLAELAAESPDDVAPSAGVIATFARSRARSKVEAPADADAETPPRGGVHALRCLAYVSRERPDAVVDHVDDVAVALSAGEQSTKWGRATLEALGEAYPERVTAVDPEVPESAPGLEVDR